MDIITRNVTSLDDAHRRAIEDVLGRALSADERLIISVESADAGPDSACDRPVQSIADWTALYADLTEDQVEKLDRAVSTRAELNRDVP